MECGCMMFSTKIFLILVLVWSKMEATIILPGEVSFTCQSVGIFPDEMNCRNYYICLRYSSISKIIHLSCPLGMNFDENTKLCLYLYPCRYPNSNANQINESTTVTTASPEIHTSICNDDDRYPNVDDPTCRTYHQCSLLSDGTYSDMDHTCQNNTFFNPMIQECDMNYTCISNSSREDTVGTTTKSMVSSVTSLETSTTSNVGTSSPPSAITTITTKGDEYPCVYIDNPEYSFCSNQGKFPNLNDLTCQTYYSCSEEVNNSLTKTFSVCPETTHFNPEIQECDESFQCPCRNFVDMDTNVTESISSEEGSTFDTEITTHNTKADSTTGTSNIFETNSPIFTWNMTSEACKSIGYSRNFSCSSEGRFRNPSDPTCQSYFLCNILKNGSFIQTMYSCPNASHFNPPTQKCDMNYSCTCESSVNTSSTESNYFPSSNIFTGGEESTSTIEIITTKKPSIIEITTTEPCEYNEYSKYFSCSSKGRYRNLNDRTCQTYYLCDLMRNGSFVQTLYSCPNTSYFNPPTQKCDVNYKCPCENPSITSSSRSISTQTPIIPTQTKESTSEILTTTSEITSTVDITTTESCEYVEDSGYFSCSIKGRYRNLNDPTCQTYYLCNLLRNGSFVQTLYSCPNTSYFNPPTQKCDVNYKCPCEYSSITSPSVLISTQTPIITTQTEESTSEILTTTSEITSTVDITTTGSCEYVEDSGYFSCSIKGRYRNLNDPTCQTYYLCNLLRNGSFVQTLYSCPNTSYFNPPTQKCDVNYKCPCEYSSITSPSVLISTQTPIITTQTEESTSEILTTTSEITSTVDITTTGSCEYVEDSGYFSCSIKGRYRNLNDPTCQTYYLCNLLRNGSFVQTLYSCPNTSYFNPPTQKCDVNYKCPCEYSSITSPSGLISTQTPIITTRTEESTSEILTTTSEITSTVEITTTESCEYVGDSGYFSCSIKGRYRNLNDPTCQTYYLCNLLRNGSFVQTLYSCPNTSYFNPPTQKCDVNYKCPCEYSSITSPSVLISTQTPIITTQTEESTSEILTTTSEITSTVEITTTASCEYVEDSGYFSCSIKGRYRNLNDPTCQTYYLCNLLRNGSFVQTLYSCPNTSYFNPPTQKCDVNYKCPCEYSSITSPSVLISTQTPIITTQTEESTSEILTTTSEITSTVEITTTESCEYVEDSGYFSCSIKGRYRNLNDPTCQTYYLCNLLRNGSFVQTLYSCPNTSYFNPPTQKCDVNYKCPCEYSSITSPSGLISTQTPIITTRTEESTSEILTTTSEITSTVEITTTESCEYVGDSGYFSCSIKGRYRNLNDPTCQTYYLCNLLRNGSFVQTLYSCPNTSYFNPPTQKCDVNYKCPCEYSSITSPSVLISTQTPIITTQTEESTSEILTTTSEITSTVEITTTASCEYVEDSGYFSCSIKGRYRNLNDPTCQTYYLCNLLRNGSFVQTLYSCPNTSYFNPPTQKCDVNYKCPCEYSSITSPSVLISTQTPIITTQTEESTSEILTTTSEITSTVEITTTESCEYVEDSGYFSCSIKGRYRNLNDPTCQTYYLCNLLRNGSFVQTLYSCPNTSYFNPPTQKCDVNYKCPCEYSSITSPSVLISTQTPIITTQTEESTSEILTTTSEITSTVEITTTESCEYVEDSGYFSCSIKGRYRNLNDPTCQTYYLCNLLRNGSFVQTLYSCPNTSYFNPPTQKCDVNYKCPCEYSSITSPSVLISTQTPIITTQTEESTSEILTTTSEITSTVEITTTESCEYVEDSGYFSCSIKGRYRNLNDPTCQTYYLCNLLRNGSFVQTLYSCPNTSYFNPPTQKCDVNYKCPCEYSSITSPSVLISTQTPIITTQTEESTSEILTTTSEITSTVEITTTESCEYVEDSGYFSCSIKGRYRNLNDPTCQTYYLCNLLRNGSFVQTLYSCPNTSYFNPPTQKCDVNYKCPCEYSSITSPSVLISTQTPIITTQTEESTSEILTTTSEITSTVEITTTESCEYVEDSGYFSCSIKGRYRNLNDPTCQTYYLCNLLRNGSFVQTLYSCPNTSYFNPPTQKCDVNYKCPCEYSSITSPSVLISTQTPIITTQTEESTSEILTTTSEITSTVEITTTESCEYVEDSGYFSCSIEGRYRNLNDPTCQTYYLCNLLRNDSFVQTLYSCPNTSYFNPPTQKCDVNYKCPCEYSSITSPSVLISTQTPIITTQTEESTSEISTTTSEITSTGEITTTESCEYVEDSGYFSCSIKGRYRNLNDPTCQTYYLCNLLRNGSFVQTLYSCPNTSYFNPPTQKCDVNYKCPCEYSSITSPSVLISTQTPIITTQTEESTSEILTTTSEITSTVDITTTESCEYVEDSGYFSCSIEGRYQNLNDPTCQTYYLCNLLRNGSFVQTLYSCPNTSYFNPPTQKCDVNYKCPCEYSSITSPSVLISTQTPIITTQTEESTSEILTTTSEITSTVEITTTESCEYVEDSGYFSCSIKGRYRNLNDPTCQTYYLCNLLRNGSFVQTLYSCPNTSFFNPPTQKCDVNYKCPCEYSSITSPSGLISTRTPIITTQTEESTSEILTTTSEITSTVEITTTESCEYVEDSGYFSCSIKGRYRNLNDPTCQTYYLCNLLRNGSFVQTLYSCPNTSYFNPPTQKCDVNYKCPCDHSSITSPSVLISTQTLIITTQTEESTSEILTTTSEITSTVEITTTESCEYVEDSGYFSCSIEGRYRNLNDPTCQTYYLCNSLRNGSFVRTLYSCPNTSYFNPQTQKCDVGHQCPCQISITNIMSSTIQGNINTTENSTAISYSVDTYSTAPFKNSSCIFVENSSYFECNIEGKFPNFSDISCQMHFVCDSLGNGSFILSHQICPQYSFFNPISQECEIDYVCPCNHVEFNNI